MGSISTVSSQTFKTYCFRAEGGKKLKEKERRRRRKQADKTPAMSRSGGEPKRGGKTVRHTGKKWRVWHLDSGDVKARAVTRPEEKDEAKRKR